MLEGVEGVRTAMSPPARPLARSCLNSRKPYHPKVQDRRHENAGHEAQARRRLKRGRSR